MGIPEPGPAFPLPKGPGVGPELRAVLWGAPAPLRSCPEPPTSPASPISHGAGFCFGVTPQNPTVFSMLGFFSPFPFLSLFLFLNPNENQPKMKTASPHF